MFLSGNRGRHAADPARIRHNAENAALAARDVLLGSPDALSTEDMALFVSNATAGNEWRRRAWPAYGMKESYPAAAREITVPVKVIVGQMDKLETLERVTKEVVEQLTELKVRQWLFLVARGI